METSAKMLPSRWAASVLLPSKPPKQKLHCAANKSPIRSSPPPWKPLGSPPTHSLICAVLPSTSVRWFPRWSSVPLKLPCVALVVSKSRLATSMPETIERVPIKLKVNGKSRAASVEPRTLLVELLREGLDLTGTHVGCDTTYCGACTVLMNGAAVKSCTIFAVQADGAEIVTVEGLEKDGQLHPIQKAFGDCYGLQCGYCTPGLMLSALQLLKENPHPNQKQIRKAIAGNTCRCTGYQNIFKAIDTAAAAMRSAGHGD